MLIAQRAHKLVEFVEPAKLLEVGRDGAMHLRAIELATKGQHVNKPLSGLHRPLKGDHCHLAAREPPASEQGPLRTLPAAASGRDKVHNLQLDKGAPDAYQALRAFDQLVVDLVACAC